MHRCDPPYWRTAAGFGEMQCPPTIYSENQLTRLARPHRPSEHEDKNNSFIISTSDISLRNRETGIRKPVTQPSKPPVFIQAFTDLFTVPLRDVYSTPTGVKMWAAANTPLCTRR
jgi:hypothetical protein